MITRLIRRVERNARRWVDATRNARVSRAFGAIGEDCRISPALTLRGYAQNIEIGSRVSVDDFVMLDCDGETSTIKIGDGTTLLPYAMLLTHGGSITLGKHCSVNPFSMLYGHGGLTIGNYVRIATHVVVIPANHRFDDPQTPITRQGLTRAGIVIEDDVWIGAGATILDGVTIRQGCVVAAGAVVDKDCGPYEVVAGVPARVIKRRA